MKISLKNKIVNRLKYFEGQWIHKGRIEERAKEWGFLADNAGRRCRELVNEGILEKKEEKGTVYYRYVLKSKYEKNTSQEKVETINLFNPA